MAVDAGSIYSAVRIQLDKLKGDVKSVETLLDQIGQSSEKNAKDTQDAFESAFDATKLAGVAAFAAITLAMKQSIKVAGDYEQSIANVQSVVMGSADTFDMLNAKAKRLASRPGSRPARRRMRSTTWLRVGLAPQRLSMRSMAC